MNGSILRFWRKLNGYSLKYIADRIPNEYSGISSTSALSRLEFSKSNVSENNLTGFFKVFGLKYSPISDDAAVYFDNLCQEYIQNIFYCRDTNELIERLYQIREKIYFDSRFLTYHAILIHDQLMRNEISNKKELVQILKLLLEFQREFNALQRQIVFDSLALYYKNTDANLSFQYISEAKKQESNIYMSGLVHYHLALIAQKNSFLFEALEAVRKSKAIFDEEMAFERSLCALIEMATLESEIKQFEKANHHFSLAQMAMEQLTLDSFEDIIFNNWIWVDMRTQSYDRMLEKANYMISRYPDIPDYYFYRGWGLAHIDSEKRSAALSSVTKAVDLLAQKDHLSRLEENFKAYVHLYKMILESRASVKTIYSMFEKMLSEFKDMPSYVKAFMLEMYYEYCMTMNDQVKGNKILEELVMIR
ncbi:MAG TPA: helix-turn-helix transcriptional regulator [Candidatus Fimiplasma intestinipullorum]|uniref:Helix-turn-helix transcriptional regulator n=1 Tax=Candidatus Fimiplasma intestinipullorum TaxID=2840825 RepID=A0A9D1HQS9_9FIRM|nr:helix-turn-helix transcriptional regulator [Candidatus Fimiplasma intestinipullorum]